MERPGARGLEALVRTLAVALISVCLACESTNAPVSPASVYEHNVTAEMVTGAALAALRSDGRFNLEKPPTAESQLSLQVVQSEAHGFALWVANQGLLRGAIEGARGGYWTDPHLLTVCRDTYFIHSQLASVVPDSLAGGRRVFQHFYGPQWLVPMCGTKDDPQMTVQAAVNENDIRFVNGQPVPEYTWITTAWWGQGVTLNWPDPLPLSAERAVRFVWETFGVRVTDVPQLYFRAGLLSTGVYTSGDASAFQRAGTARSCNRWRVKLENEVRVRGLTSQLESTTRVLWIAAFSCNGLEPTIQIPLENQPATVTVDLYDENVTPKKRWTFEVPVVAPIRFELGARSF